MAQDNIQWLALVNMITNLRVPQKGGISLSAEQLLASQGKLSFMELVVSTCQGYHMILPNFAPDNILHCHKRNSFPLPPVA
jgi:hypothetical protein